MVSKVLATRPITTEPNATHYEWAGATLQRLFKRRQPIAEMWPFFSGPQKPARIANGRGVTMEDLVTARPEVLGPAGADPDNHGQKYFFVKFLDPSDFPPFAYVGFRPEAAARLRTAVGLKAHVAELLWEDRQAVERLAELVRPRVDSAEAFAKFKAAYKCWAIEQARADWRSDATLDVKHYVTASQAALAASALKRQQRARQAIVRLVHRIDFEDDQAILIETPTLHAIAGLSLQLHPRTPDNFYPKDELWIYKRVGPPGKSKGWLLVEPQRTFDKTESGGDFFTPFAWTGVGAAGRLGFRKSITRTYLHRFVSLMDATAYPKSHYVRKAATMTIPGGTTTGRAQWYRLLEEAAWPYFLVRELRFEGAGQSVTPLPHHSFIELHATQGEVTASLGDGRRTRATFTVSPTQPAFLPASLPDSTITYRATRPACLHFFTR